MSVKKDWIKKDKYSPKSQNIKQQQIQDMGENIQLSCKYVLWCHEVSCKDWSLQGYTKLCTISNVSEFWRLFNNINKLGYKINNFFLMKEGIDPTWEHEKNRDGGICSMKTEIGSALQVYEELCSYMVCDILSDCPTDINGVSFCPKNNWGIIKIWNGDKKNDLSITLNKDLINKYPDQRYTENQPEF